MRGSFSRFEALEDRKHLSVSYGTDIGGNLHVVGSNGADKITIQVIQNGPGGQSFRIYDGRTIAAVLPTTGLNGLIVNGAAGHDILTLDSGFASLPSSFYIEVNGDQGNDILNGGAADDHLNGGIGNDAVCGGAGDDQIIGDEGNDFLSGESGNDYLVPGTGNNVVLGGAGDDIIWINPEDIGCNLFDGGRGTDTIIRQAVTLPRKLLFSSIELFQVVEIGVG